MSYYLGLDVGGTTLRAAIATEDADPLGTVVTPTPQGSGEGAVTREICHIVGQVCDVSGIDPAEVTAAGIGSVGPLEQESGTITGPANIFGDTDRIQLVQPLCELLATDAIVLHNDATCGVIAERQVADAATENMVYLTVSTGIGAGIIVDGNVVHGADGNAGEVGHTTVDPAGTMTCGCGSEGHWEAYCGGANIPRYAAYLHREELVETDLPVTDADFSAKDVFENAGGDDLAELVVERVGYWNTVGVATLVQTFAPRYVAVGGAVARNNPDAVLDPVRENLPARVLGDVPEIQVAACSDDVVLTGALLAAQRHAERSD